MSEARKIMSNAEQESEVQGGQAGGQRESQGLSGESAIENAKSTAGYVADQAENAASHVAQEGHEVASFLGGMSREATSAVAGGLKSASQSLRHYAPQEGALGKATSAVANTLEGTGRHLEEEGLKGLGDDLTRMIKNNPIPSLLIGIGIGYLVSQASSSSRR